MSWREIAKATNIPALECKKRWISLRDRYSKEKRLKVLETRSGSGASRRAVFQYSDEMAFLDKYIKRRQVLTNFNSKTTTNQCTRGPSSNTPPNTFPSRTNNIQNFQSTRTCIGNDKVDCSLPVSARQLMYAATSKAGTEQVQPFLLEIPEPSAQTHEQHNVPNLQSPRPTSASGSSAEPILQNLPASQLPSLPSSPQSPQLDGNMKEFRQKNKKKRSADTAFLEKSLASLSDTMQKRFAAPQIAPDRNALDMSCLSADRTFGLLVGTELEKTPEPEKTIRKKEIMAILWRQVNH